VISGPATLVRWLVDPARQEELLGDLEELRGRGAPRLWIEAASACLRLSRLTAPGRTRTRLAVLVVLLAVVALCSRTSTRRSVRALDPAGEFTIEFDGARVVGVTLDGALVAPERLVQTRGRLVIRGGGDAGHDLNIRLGAHGSFYWRARTRGRPQLD